ncbi:MAG: hypothetical protein WD068_02215 [Candidatus Babeliales bacterium]
MLFSSTIAHTILLTIARILAYFPTITFSGYLQAWLEKKMGDDTGEQMGLMSLNPMVHFNILGFIFLLFFGWGWGSRDNLTPQRCAYFPRHRFGYLMCMFARPTAHFILLIAGLCFMIILGGLFYQTPIMTMLHGNPTLITVLREIVMAFLMLNLLSVALYFMMSLFMLFMLRYSDQLRVHTEYADFILLALFIVVWLILAPYIQFILFWLLALVEQSIRFLVLYLFEK